ncbi:hypothetical protein GCM10009547_48210 [Sporichthya brevicatena]|uniref:Uncharacterized protein n=1 Tax=Sporichthya brevicatena TaxID=171442 RepID=A0ABN1HCJ5_9ACTN
MSMVMDIAFWVPRWYAPVAFTAGAPGEVESIVKRALRGVSSVSPALAMTAAGDIALKAETPASGVASLAVVVDAPPQPARPTDSSPAIAVTTTRRARALEPSRRTEAKCTADPPVDTGSPIRPVCPL